MKIVIGTYNQGKLNEIRTMLADTTIELYSQADLGVPDVEETGLSFIENAIIKARNGAKHSNLPCIGDDSGLAVDVLGGAPGIYSARYAGDKATAGDNITKLLQAIESIPDEDRVARFHCAIAFVRHAKDPTPLIFQGSWEGQILNEPRGTQGFGYDPIFYLPELGRTAGELDIAQKNAQSHRAKALNKLVNHFITKFGL